MTGRVLIIDDVISAGTSVRESMDIIRAAGAQAAGVVIALDRMERGTGALSAVQEVEASYGVPVISVAGLDDLIGYLEASPELQQMALALDRFTPLRQEGLAPWLDKIRHHWPKP